MKTMITIELSKASPLGKTEVEGRTIIIDRPTPEFPSLEVARISYETQAAILAQALTDSLPQGTLDRLLIALMERCASLYRGRAGT